MNSNCSWSSRLTNVLTMPFVLWGIATLAAQLTAEWLFKHEQLRTPVRFILRFLPALLAIFFVVAFVKHVRNSDEMVRRIHLQAASIAFLLTVTLEFVFDGLESAGIFHATRGNLFSVLVLTWAVALIFLSWRHR